MEPLYAPTQNILEDSLKREIERICFAEQLLNRVIYDSIDENPFLKVRKLFA